MLRSHHQRPLAFADRVNVQSLSFVLSGPATTPSGGTAPNFDTLFNYQALIYRPLNFRVLGSSASFVGVLVRAKSIGSKVDYF